MLAPSAIRVGYIFAEIHMQVTHNACCSAGSRSSALPKQAHTPAYTATRKHTQYTLIKKYGHRVPKSTPAQRLPFWPSTTVRH